MEYFQLQNHKLIPAMKNYSYTFLLVLLGISLSAQTLQWQNLINGSGDDHGRCLLETPSGHIIFGGISTSNDADIPFNNGGSDVVIGKMEKDGDILWLITEGGNKDDHVKALENTIDGGILAVGYTRSDSSAYTGHRGDRDALILKFDGDGNFLWRKIIGGSERDVFEDLIPTDDGGFLLAGYSGSKDFDLEGLVGAQQFEYNGWLVKVDGNGNIEWQQVIGDGLSSNFQRIEKAIDGGYIIIGGQSLPGGFRTATHYGFDDMIMVKVSEAGVEEWQQNFGGSNIDVVADLLVVDERYLMLGWSYSSDFDIPSNQGFSDAALFSIDQNGNLDWVKMYGGGGSDVLSSINPTIDGNFLLSGKTGSTNPSSSWLLLAEENGDKISEQLKTDNSGLGPYGETIRTSEGAYHFIGTNSTVINNVSFGDIWLGRLILDFDIIQGKVYVDLNNNGLQDSDEPLAKDLSVFTEQSSFQISTNDSDGNYQLFVQAGDWITSIADQSPYFSIPENDQPSSFVRLGEVDTINFRLLVADMVPEVEVDLIPITAARPSFITSYDLVISNKGSIAISGEASVKIPIDKLNFRDASVSNISTDPELLTFTFSDLGLFQQKKIRLNFKMKALGDIQLSDSLVFESSVPPVFGELDLDDNISILYQEITGSFDPNDKTILSKKSITPIEFSNGATAKYLIRFQNTGNDTAFNIVVADTLSNQHILETFKPITSSHSYRTLLEPNGRLQVFYDDIQLVDSIQNEPESHGYFSFEIDLRSRIPVDSVVENTAHIYFDFNPPIVTNTTQLKIQEPIVSSSKEGQSYFDDFELFPNPVEETFSIEFVANHSETVVFQIMNLEGKTIQQKKRFVQKGENLLKFDCQELKSGSYLLAISTDDLSFSKVFFKY